MIDVAIFLLFSACTGGVGTLTLMSAPGWWKLVGIPLILLGLMAVFPPPAALIDTACSHRAAP